MTDPPRLEPPKQLLDHINAAFTEYGVSELRDLPGHVQLAIISEAKKRNDAGSEVVPVMMDGLVVIATMDVLGSSGREALHFSISAPGRKPTDEEVKRVLDLKAPGLEMTEHEAQANPYVRHFFAL